MTNTLLTLAAEDAEDLEILSARLQDAVGKVGDFKFLPKARRFVAVLNRFQWENGKKGDQRVRAGLHFDNVLNVRSKNIKMGAPGAILSLLAIRFTPGGAADSENPAGLVELVFSGGGVIALDVECISAGLADVSGPWAARGRPSHEEG
ncbi:hypothetical protein FHS83_002474 [Rhizomicrobium palustre]|uniref:DUF2948 family protein n=1 Tax=Rhizomicrobium palustre TaxID=189966 RepID=A0A846N0D9_9PROT|nr:DUF2948 family protein [Rhizomicrobium palustre]NIK89156.1 hypothetical protein [Rhizomicrobium palustre]